MTQRQNHVRMGKPTVRVVDEYGNPKANVRVKWRKVPPWETVDWVELGCRGWEIDTHGARLGSIRAGPAWCHLGNADLDIAFAGSPAFLRRVYDDLVAAGVRGLKDNWIITTYPPTGSAMQWVTL